MDTTPRTWVADEVVSATQLNQEIRDPLTALQAEADTWTPTLVGFAQGNGLITARYHQVGRWIDFLFTFVAGTGSTFVGATGMTFSLPEPMITIPGSPLVAIGSAFFVDGGSVGSRTGGTAYAAPGSSACALLVDHTAGAFVNASTPWTWASTDTIGVTGRYECEAP